MMSDKDDDLRGFAEQRAARERAQSIGNGQAAHFCGLVSWDPVSRQALCACGHVALVQALSKLTGEGA